MINEAKTVSIGGNNYYVYADLQDADVYCAAIKDSIWSALNETQQAQLLVMATRQIDSYKYIGSKVDENQPLKFPRVNSKGVQSDEQLLIDVTCQIANYMSVNGTSTSSASASQLLAGISKWQVGDFNVTLKNDATITLDTSTLDDLIKDLLEDWLVSRSMEIWL